MSTDVKMWFYICVYVGLDVSNYVFGFLFVNMCVYVYYFCECLCLFLCECDCLF